MELASLARTSTPAVVGVHTGRRDHRRSGSGTVVATDTVLTAAHNVGGRAPTLLLHDGRRVEATVVAATDDLDLAVLTADLDGIAPLEWGDASAVAIGDAVAAMAAPDGVSRLTQGTVASLGARVHTRSGAPLDGVMDHTAPLMGGASGGPVLGADGRVLAIDVNRLRGGLYQALLATPELVAAVAALADGRVPEPKRLGVTLTPGRRARNLRDAVGLPARDGALILGVREDSAAAHAGLGRGDLVVGVGDQPVRSVDDLHLALRRAGDSLSLTVVRGVDERHVEVAFA